MGKRRIRNLRSLGYSEISGFDIREDRRKEAENLFGINTVSDLEPLSDFDSVIISTSPDMHTKYIRAAIEKGKPCFVELSLLIQELPELDRLARLKGVLIAPSCTFRFRPAIKRIKDLVESRTYGKITNFTYHSGQYLPDWHPWENVKDFFVSKKETSGCKEILSFELRWMTDVMGSPEDIFSCRGKTAGFDIDIDDTYAVSMKFNGHLGVILIDLVSRFATRSLILNLEKAQIRWNCEDNAVRLYDAENKEWTGYREVGAEAVTGCNSDITGNMYIEEMRAFVEAVKGVKPFPITLGEDIEILHIVERADADVRWR